jgi:hypothetical protein
MRFGQRSESQDEPLATETGLLHGSMRAGQENCTPPLRGELPSRPLAGYTDFCLEAEVQPPGNSQRTHNARKITAAIG